MTFKPNYQQQRGDRTRVKDQKKQAKLRRREEQSNSRKDLRDDHLNLPGNSADQQPDSTSEAGEKSA